MTQATIHQRLRDEHGLDASVASFRRWVAANLPEEARRAQVTVLRDTAAAGAGGADRLRQARHVDSTRAAGGGSRCGRS